MGKRNRLDEPGHDRVRHQKRSRLETQAHTASADQIDTPRQLANILQFQQDEALLLKSIASLKAFLNAILYPENEDDVPRQRAILREYLESQQPREVDDETEYLPSLMQAWNFASSSNNDKTLSIVTSVVDQLLKVLSNHLDFRETGLLLCKTVLQQPQLKILSRGLTSPKNKEHVIGPCLRVLKEVVCFDGGVLARQLYAKRDLAFDPQVIARCLTNRRMNSEDPEDVVTRPSVRTTTIRYLIANLKFQDDAAKADMLKQGSMMRALVEGIEGDHPRMIREMLEALKLYVIEDTAIPKRNKGFLFNSRNLCSLSELYRASFPSAEEGQRPLLDVVHEFMVLACTSEHAGVARPSGWYPSLPDEEIQSISESLVDLGIDGMAYYSRFNKEIPIRNYTLSELIISLRPYASDLERRLLKAILEAAPELVAWFYRKMAVTFPFTPKLTATWIGYAATLFDSVRLPIPRVYAKMSHMPPPPSIMIESVLPAPLSEKTLRLCLASNSSLVRFFAVNIITASLQKLRDTLDVMEAAAKHHSQLWEEGQRKLIEEFCRRCPALPHFIKLYSELKKGDDEKMMQREATLRLLTLYHQALPQVALEEGYDVSIPLTNALEDLDAAQKQNEQLALKYVELGHLLQIASCSSSVHWWDKKKDLNFSPFTTLLRLFVKSSTITPQVEQLIAGIAEEPGILQGETKTSALEALVASLRRVDGPAALEAILGFLDKCFSRFSKRPIKYEDDRSALVSSLDDTFAAKAPCSLLIFVIIEQWPFLQVAQHMKPAVSAWVLNFLILLQAIGEIAIADIDTKQFLPEGMKMKTFTKEHQILDTTTAREVLRGSESGESRPLTNGHHVTATNDEHKELQQLSFNMSNLAPPPEPENYPVLARHRKKDLATLIDSGDLSLLIQPLTSTHASIRAQALTALRTIHASVLTSTHPEKETLYILLGSLLETCVYEKAAETPLPGLLSAFAQHALPVLTDPTHTLYPKINEFLNKGPSWRVRQMPAHFLAAVLHHPPGDPDTAGSYWREACWVLDWLYDGLLSPVDVEICRRNAVFERLMALFSHPSLRRGRFWDGVFDAERVRREASLQGRLSMLLPRLVGRAAVVGGATSLVTGAGVLAWLDFVRGSVGGDAAGEAVVEALRLGISESAEAGKVEEWRGARTEPVDMA